MPNGTGLTAEQFEALERPLRHLDGALRSFAQHTNGAVVENYHNSPDRRITWVDSSGVTRSVLISPVDNSLTANVDRPGSISYVVDCVAFKDFIYSDALAQGELQFPLYRRKLRHQRLRQLDALPSSGAELFQLLQESLDFLNGIHEADLMPS